MSDLARMRDNWLNPVDGFDPDEILEKQVEPLHARKFKFAHDLVMCPWDTTTDEELQSATQVVNYYLDYYSGIDDRITKEDITEFLLYWGSA